MTPEPWKPLAKPTRMIKWKYCIECGKRYLVPLVRRAPITLEALEKDRRKAHICRTPEQVQALREYEEAEL